MTNADILLILFDISRYIYWSDWEDGKIERCRYDGSEREVIMNQPDAWINGIALDVNGRLL